MKIKYLNSASVIIEDEDVKILCDPWLVSGEYYGSWGIYPPYDFKPEDFDDIDYIYISHIHPDHCSTKTLAKLNKNIPVFILNFLSKYLKNKIETLGFHVRELEHDQRTHIKKNLHINIVAADYCDPSICKIYFGCGPAESKFGATHIDTMCVIDNKKQVIVNTNDCPFQIAQTSAHKIKNQLDHVDMLLVGYSGALAHPQCFDYSKSEFDDAIKLKKKKYFDQAEKYINLFKPRYFLPFAGRYTLAGKLSTLNSKLGIPELEEAYDYFVSKIDQKKHKCIVLNQNTVFDISKGQSENHFKRIGKEEKWKYLENVLSSYKFDFELESMPTVDELMEFIPKSYERFKSKCNELLYSSDWKIFLDLPKKKSVEISCDGSGYKLVNHDQSNSCRKFLRFTLDPRLLKWILEGPKKAHWNNAEIGSHIKFEREPDIYDRALHYCFNFFYS